MATEDAVRLRQYLLGELSDEQNAALEEEYFALDATFDRVCVAEDELIDRYLSDGLSPADRERFDRHYLAAPHHHSRVAIARELRRAAAERSLAMSRHASDSTWPPAFVNAVLAWPPGLKVAATAALLLIALGGVWVVGTRPGSLTVSQSTEPLGASVPATEDANRPDPARTSPIVVAATLSPAGVRGPDEAPTVTIQPGAQLVVLDLERDAAGPPLSADHAAVRRMSGAEVWRGRTVSEAGSGPVGPVRLEMPVDALPRDDYVVMLFGTEANGREIERYRYFLRVR